MLSEKLKQAIMAVKSGDKTEGRKLLVDILDSEPTNETAWLWFTDTLDGDAEKKIALEGLLKIIPTSQAARLGLERLADRQSMDEPAGEAGAPEEKTMGYQPLEMDSEETHPVEADVEGIRLLEEIPAAEAINAGGQPLETDAEDAPPVGMGQKDGHPLESDAEEVYPLEMGGKEGHPLESDSEAGQPAGAAPAPVAAVATPTAGTPTLGTDGPSGGPVKADQTPAVTAATPAAESTPAPQKTGTGLARILLILVAFLVLGGAVYLFGSMLGLFTPTAKVAICKCADTNAYLLRVQDRVSRWLENQSTYDLVGTQGDAPQNTDIAQKVYDEEQKDNAPVCLKDLHDTLLTTFENQIKYGTALQNNDAKQIEYYRSIENGTQDTLKQQFETLRTGLKCTQ